MGLFVGLLLLVLFTFGCSEKQETVSENILYFEIENSENTMWRTYTIEEQGIDMFAKWQERQPNELEQDKWDAYMAEQ